MNYCLYQSKFWCKIMRITFSQILILLLMTALSYAKPSLAQEVLNKKINLTIKNKSINEALKVLSQTNQVQFVYNQDIIPKKEKVSITANNEALKQVLDQLLIKYNISYQVYKSKIILVDAEKLTTNIGGTIVKSNVQAIPVTGKVTDETKLPLIGVSVKVKGTNIGTQTDLDGNYSLNVPDNTAILVFTYIGFNSQEIPVNDRTNVSVQMKAQANSLSEVVVVGYGTQKRSDVTGAVASANLEDFRNAPNTNIAQSLQGTVPGLNVGQVTSAGSTPPISIRGTNTISGNANVLIVLDGIQYNGSLESINPDDIASIDVLKDASSTAVYGAQAANGVLLITSRKGKKNQNPRISFSSSYATQTPTGSLRPMNRQEYLDHVRDLYYDEAYLAPSYTQPNPAFNLASKLDASMVDASGNIVANDYNWYNQGTHTGHIIDNQLSVSGGGDKFNYLLSGNMTDQSGFIKNDLFKRKGIRVNLESQATSWLKLGIQSFGSFVNKDGAEPNLSNLVRLSPLVVPYDASGNLIPYPTNSTLTNPFLNYAADDYERHNYLFANIYTEINFPFVKGLTYRLNFGNNYRINLHNSANVYGAGLTGEAYKNSEYYYDYTLDNILTYNRTFDKHDISATLLYGSIQRSDNYTSADATAFSRLTLGYNSLEQGTNQFTNSDAWKEALEYQMARLNYKYDNKYLLTTTIRRDGFSGFAANHKYGYFPSVALGWIVTNEPFFKTDWVDNLKVRVGYGVSGNQTSRY
ncbi:MAG: SusC/RagA family TonB-linked outer membrane protein, partial [Sphingobacteriaceae bacterium]